MNLELIANVATNSGFQTAGFQNVSDLINAKTTYNNGDIVEAGGYRYQVADASAKDHNLTTASGAKLYIASSMPRYTPHAFGYDASGSISEKTAILQRWIECGLPLLLPAGDWEINRTLGGGCHIDLKGENNARIVAKAGTYDKAVITATGDMRALPSLASNVSRFDMVLTFSRAHGLEIGDDFLIHNPKDYSFSAAKDAYRAGEACQVIEVISDRQVILSKPLFAGYAAADVRLWKLAPRKVAIENIEIVAPGAANAYTHCIKLDIATEPMLYGVSCKYSGGSNIMLARCLRGELDGVKSIVASADAGTSTEYGLTMNACQDMSIKGTFYGRRHAVTTSSTAVDDGGIVNREIRIHDSELSSLYNYAADFHGNTEWSGYDNCSINGGANIRGNHMYIKNCRIRTSDYQNRIGVNACINMDMLTGFDHTISNCELHSNADFRTDGGPDRAAIGCTTSNALCDGTVEGGTLKISDVKIDAPNTRRMISVRNQGCTQDLKVEIDNVDFGTSTRAESLIEIRKISGKDFMQVKATNISDPSKNAMTISDAARIVTSGQSGKGIVTWTGSDSQKTAVVKFEEAFPATPIVLASLSAPNDGGIGSTGLNLGIIAVSPDKFTLRVATADGTKFASDTSATFYWRASLD